MGAEKKLIAHFTHHKCGTNWIFKILKEIANEFNLKFQRCEQYKLKNNTDIWLQHHSDVDFIQLPPYVGSHMIRDPRDIIISGYFYHLWTKEEWCNQPKDNYSFRSYQQVLQGLSQQDGILFEIKSRLKIMKNLINWDYNNPNILEMRYEDFIFNNQNFIKLFEKYGFSNQQIKCAYKIAEKNSFQNLTKRKLGEEKRNKLLRQGMPNDWKNYFTEKHKVEFKRLYQDVLIKLKYEKNDQW